MDEISIKNNLDYFKKHAIIEDYGNGERMKEFGSQIMIFMIRGLYNNWKVPFAYFVS